jgi:hypothetical protein
VPHTPGREPCVLQLSADFRSLERYQTLEKLLSDQALDTIRDVSRLTGTFHAIAGMLRDEVDWIDLLGFSALLTKALQTVERIRAEPDRFTDAIYSEAAMMRRIASEMDRGQHPTDELFHELVPISEDRPGNRALLGFLFPKLSDASSRSDDDTRLDALFRRRPFQSRCEFG